MEASVRALFDRYERAFRRALEDKADMTEVAGFYAAEFIAASPAGVATGRNDEQLISAISQGYAHYRSIGTTDMRVRSLRITSIDAHHCLAHVAWTATYARAKGPETRIDFDVHYLVQKLAGDPSIFGWVSGDEQAVLRQHGII